MIWHVIEALNAVMNGMAVLFVLVTVHKGRKAMKAFENFGKPGKK